MQNIQKFREAQSICPFAYKLVFCMISDRERLKLKPQQMEYMLYNPYCSTCNTPNMQAQRLPLFLKGLGVQVDNLNFKYEKNMKDADP